MISGSTSTKSGKRKRLRHRLLKPAWGIHKWLGIVFAVPVIIICFTGAVLVHYSWLERVLEENVHRVSPVRSNEMIPLENIIQSILSRHSSFTPRFIEAPMDPNRNVVVSMADGEDRWTIIVDAVTGQELELRKENSGPRRCLVALHSNLFLDRSGDYIAVGTSLMLVISSITGFLLYGRAWRRIFQWKDLWRDSHRHLGFLIMGLIVVISMTGFLLTMSHLLIPHKQTEKSSYDWSRLPNLQTMVEKAVRISGGGLPDYLALPNSHDDSIHVAVFHRQRKWWEKYDSFEFDGITGDIISANIGPKSDIVTKINSLVGALHFGHQGGELMKWLYFAGGIIPVWLVVSGILVSLRKGKKRSPDKE